MRQRFLIIASLIIAGTSMAAFGEVRAPYEPVRRDGNAVETIKHRITVNQAGLPEQFYIKAHRTSLPLEARDGAALNDDQLRLLGRGSQLRTPIRLEAVVEGQRSTAEVRRQAAVSAASNDAVTYTSTLAAGALQLELTARYEYDGAMLFTLTYQGDAANVDQLELVMEIEGIVDLAYRGLPADFTPDAVAFDQLDVSLPADADAIVWNSNTEWPGGGKFLNYLTFGSRDRAFTWLSDTPEGFVLSEDTPMAVIERNRLGQPALRVRFIAEQGAPAAQRTAKFAIIPHPSKPRPLGMRNTQWLGWAAMGAELQSDIDGVDKASLALRERLMNEAAQGKKILATPLAAGAYESAAAAIELRGFAGADGLSAEKDNMRLYPNSLFSVLAGPFRNQPTRIRSNVRGIAHGGMNPNYDRQIVARALLFDIGAAIDGLRQPVELLRLASELKKFGFFDDDETEFLPFWRNQAYLRYGEGWIAEDQFEVQENDPAANVYVSAYRRKLERDGQAGIQVLFILVNENDHPVRERLHILDPEKLFGGPNRMMALDLTELMDYSFLSEHADWYQMPRRESRYWNRRHQALLDLEDNGAVEHWNVRYAIDTEIYGQLFVYPRSFRIIHGYWLPEVEIAD